MPPPDPRPDPCNSSTSHRPGQWYGACASGAHAARLAATLQHWSRPQSSTPTMASWTLAARSTPCAQLLAVGGVNDVKRFEWIKRLFRLVHSRQGIKRGMEQARPRLSSLCVRLTVSTFNHAVTGLYRALEAFQRSSSPQRTDPRSARGGKGCPSPLSLLPAAPLCYRLLAPRASLTIVATPPCICVNGSFLPGRLHHLH